MAEFFEIRSTRERDGDIIKRTFQSVDVPDVTLFAWEADGCTVHLQLLFAGRFAEWSMEHGLSMGRQVRERERGVRSLLREREGPMDRDIVQRLLAAHRFPDDIVAPLRDALEEREP